MQKENELKNKILQITQNGYSLKIENYYNSKINLQNYLQKKTTETVKYDKIPVYSSCVVSEANGQYTIPTTGPTS